MGDIDYQALAFAYRRPAPFEPDAPAHPVVVVGAGPVGLTAAIDLALHGLQVIVLDDDCRLSSGSRAICFSKRTLEIWDRLGVGQRMMDKGVSWNMGRIFFRDQEVWRFDLQPEPGQRRPAFINLQQYYAEGYLQERAAGDPRIDLRWQSKVVAAEPSGEGVTLTVQTPEGAYPLRAEWVVACDGARSPLRKMIGQETHGRVFRDRFLIADVRMAADFPSERWFWFDPPFHPGQSVLLHRQPDNVWRIDFQLGWDVDPVEAIKPENVLPRLRALLGEKAHFELEWVSVYTFACERMDAFCHRRVLFAGDAAHRVSPFGARGANSGVQDADNLAWKLALVMRGQAPADLVASYGEEREYAADENIAHSSRATDFITPKSGASRIMRNAVLNLARNHAFARALVNSGRLSLPASYRQSSLNTLDADRFAGMMQPGTAASDAPVECAGGNAWWLSFLGHGFTLALFCGDTPPQAATLSALEDMAHRPIAIRPILVFDECLPAMPAPPSSATVCDPAGALRQRYDGQAGTCYLIRPDQHIAARWRRFDPARIQAALRRATRQPGEKEPSCV